MAKSLHKSMDLSILYVTMIVVLPGLVLSYVIIDVHDMCLAFGADLRPGPGFSVVQVSPFRRLPLYESSSVYGQALG